jgi:hypothetical protein
MKNKTRRRIHKYFYLIIFISYFSAKIPSEGMPQPTIHQMREESFIEEKSRKTKRFNIHTTLNDKLALLVHISAYPLIENYPQSNSYLCIKIKAQKVHLFRPSLGFLAEADPRLEKRR